MPESLMLNQSPSFPVCENSLTPKDHFMMLVRTAVAKVLSQDKTSKIVEENIITLQKALEASHFSVLFETINLLRARNFINQTAKGHLTEALTHFGASSEGVAQSDDCIVKELHMLLSRRFRSTFPNEYRKYFSEHPPVVEIPEDIQAAGAGRWFQLYFAYFHTSLAPWKEQFFSGKNFRNSAIFPEDLPGFHDELAVAVYGDYLRWIRDEIRRERADILIEKKGQETIQSELKFWMKKYFSHGGW